MAQSVRVNSRGESLKAIDKRLTTLLNSGYESFQRSLIIIVGDGGLYQVPNLFSILKMTRTSQLSIMWCYDEMPKLSSNKRKRNKEFRQLKNRGELQEEELSVEAQFYANTNIRYLHYRDTELALGTTVDMLILQDFKALTPNIIGQTVECVRGGGLILFLLNNMHDLSQLHAVVMNFHSRFSNINNREVSNDLHIKARFNSRFIALLEYLPRFLLVNDTLEVIQITEGIQNLMTNLSAQDGSVEKRVAAFTAYKNEHKSSSLLAKTFISLCATLEQAKLVIQVLEMLDNVDRIRKLADKNAMLEKEPVKRDGKGPREPSRKRYFVREKETYTREDISESSVDQDVDASLEEQNAGHELLQTLTQNANALATATRFPICSLIAARGRGKSASLGLIVALMIFQGYNHVLISAPNPINVQTVFEFCIIGLKALDYQEARDYTVRRVGPKATDPIIELRITRKVKQVIAYIMPSTLAAYCQANERASSSILNFIDAILLDECAAIPLKLVRQIVDNVEANMLCFISSTCYGYEASGRALSLKLLHDLERSGSKRGQGLVKLSLNEPIRYAPNDSIEKWVNQLLCLDQVNGLVTSLEEGPEIAASFPQPQSCTLYRVNKDALFSGLPQSELFLQTIWSIFSASHYKNSPNDLILLSDNPLHEIFVLCPPITDSKRIPTVLCACQICYEGKLKQNIVKEALSQQKRLDGDMIAWLLSQQFQDVSFSSLSGARVVRIATNASYMRGGYGSHTLELLSSFFKEELLNPTEIKRLEAKKKERIEKLAKQKGISINDAKQEIEALTPALLQNCGTVYPSDLTWLGVGFGITLDLLNFWRKNQYLPVYIRQTRNETTGEHTCLMVRSLKENPFINNFATSFRSRFLRLLRYDFAELPIEIAFKVSWPTNTVALAHDADQVAIRAALTKQDVVRLRGFVRHQLDFMAVRDLVPILAELIFTEKLSPISLSHASARIFLGIGLMNMRQLDVAQQLGLVSDVAFSQVESIFTKTVEVLLRILEPLVGLVAELGAGASK